MSYRILSFCSAIVFSFMIFFSSSASALTVSSLYGDTTGSSSVVENLVNYAVRYDDFYFSKYVIFRDGQYSYYLAWCENEDLEVVNNETINMANCKHVHYYRESNNYDYRYSLTENDTLSVKCDYLVTTNIQDVKGFNSVLVDDYNFNFNCRRILTFTLIMIIFFGLCISVRRA